MKLILVELQKLYQKCFWSFSEKIDRLRKFTIMRPNFRNELSLKLNLSKNVFNKIWCPKLILFNEEKINKESDNF